MIGVGWKYLGVGVAVIDGDADLLSGAFEKLFGIVDWTICLMQMMLTKETRSWMMNV